MSFIETALEGKNEKERKSKAVCAVAIVITAILLVLAIIAFTICQIVSTVDGGGSNSDYKIERTEKITLAENAVTSGNLLTLDENNYYAGIVDGVKIYFTAKENNTFLSVRSANRENFLATQETMTALCNMVNACNNALNDNNLVVAAAYDSKAANSNDAIYSAGTAVAFNYYNNGELNDEKSITGAEQYLWLYENAHTYGFIAKAQDSNIFRYVGVDFATAIKANNDTFESFTAKLKEATPEKPVFLNTAKTKAAYYCPIDNVQVPVNYSYSHCGDNIGGVYITVDFLTPKAAN